MKAQTERGGPPPARDRPNIQVAATATSSRLADASDEFRVLVAQAAALVAEIGDQAERDRASFDAGYREAAALFFRHGVDVGYGQAENDMARAWSRLAKTIRDWANSPKNAKLQEHRYPGRTREELLLIRGRDRYPLPDRECTHCDGTGMFSGGAA